MASSQEVITQHSCCQRITRKDEYEEVKESIKHPKELMRVAATHPADCGTPMGSPPWLDTDKLKMAQSLFRRHFLGVFISNLVGLLCLLAVHSVLKVLVFTRRSSVRAAAFRRYLSTMNHVRKWYTEDVFDPDSSAFRSIQQVRKMHSNAFRSAESAQVSTASQADMMVTQWAFFGVLLTRGHRLGVRCSREEEEGLVHFWKSIGHLLGIEDRFNLASGELEEVRTRCEKLNEVMAAALVSPPDQFSAMAEALLWGVHGIVPMVDPPAFTAFTHNMLGLPQPTLRLSWYSLFMLRLMEYNFSVLVHLPLMGRVLQWYQNGLLTLAINTCTLYPSVPAFCGKVEKAVLQAVDAVLAVFQKDQISLVSG
ncbi:uncharacterized protein LOC123517488 isoform X2 [Portunus trituberculatus]|uniref:uncharacterized protein LOC123517488 isoform X2 n=1 Tax=Portunus trituberculatus TaxID=210409 RepID=UPI001E1CFE84|nr:uncharacterized protein LOC123517488 isoform X2 [Portunus trituberculatus]